MKYFFITLIVVNVSLQVCGQCPSGSIIFRDAFGGSFASVDIGPALTNGSSPYAYSGNAGIAAGEYSLRKHTLGINNWADGTDNTGQGGYMMMVRSKISLPIFYETTVQGFCRANSQAVCFAAASLSKKGTGLDVSIHVEVRNATTNSLLATYTSAALKNNDSISWSTYTFSYPLPKGVSSVKLAFSFTSSSSVPDDFAIDEIRVVNIGATSVNGNESGAYPMINGRYEYPVFACLNERVVFSMGNGQPVAGKEYQWERQLPDHSYERIPGATSNIYVIDSAKRSDSRFYRLRTADSGYIHSANCSTPSSPSGLHVDPEPQISGLTPICEGTDLNIQVDEGSYVAWTGPNGFTATGKKINIPKTTVANSGIYAAKVTYNAGCVLEFVSKKEIVIIKNPIKLDLPADTTICKGSSITLDATNNPGMLYVWSTGDNTPTIRVKDDGLYGVIVFADGNCSRYDSIYVHVVERPSVSLRSDTTLCTGDTLLLNPVTTKAIKYKWSTGDVTPILSVTQKGQYTLQVTNGCGTNTASVNIGFSKCSEDLFVPTAFTPNRDGLNDVFRAAQDISLQKFRMKIYNRSGQPIFSSDSISKGWDGTINREDQPLGTYVWVIDYTSKTGKQYTIKGTVTLIR
jgi:gliding motility-associated-like protein